MSPVGWIAGGKSTHCKALGWCVEGRRFGLALRFDRLVREGVVENYADLARLGGVSFARMSQILNLLNLAPDIQELLLFLRKTPGGHDPLSEWNLRDLVAEADWTKQRRHWAKVKIN